MTRLSKATSKDYSVPTHARATPGNALRLKPLVAALAALGLASPPVLAAPEGGAVRAGDARISGGGALTRIDQASQRAVIDWRSFGIGAAERVQFVQPSTKAATLNRVTGEQASVILGRMDANGHVFLINPNGILFGGGAQINVAGLVASTSNISNANFMAGRLIFDQPGKPGAGVVNAGTITAAEGGLVALVAPHVRNDGLIQARLGKVALGAADTFVIDLYGDTLINLALSDSHIGQLRDFNGKPVGSLITQAGQIDAAGGQAVLITAAAAKNVLDNLINMSGTIKADAAIQDGGRILLVGEGGRVDVGGTLSARGIAGSGGRIGVLGGDVRVASTAQLDASGTQGGGTIHVGGAYQGSGDTYRARETTVDAGAVLKANATDTGNGGEVVVWSDGHTAFGGSIEAKGGANGGNGGRMEVSGKGTLDFLGFADASAPRGQVGSLLLDPAFLNIGLADAALISRVLRTGTSTSLAADVDINVNGVIDGRGRIAGGGLTLSAGNNINVNDFIVTNNGAIVLLAAAGTVVVAPGKAVFAGGAPITVQSGGTLRAGPFVTGGALTLTSTAGSVATDAFIDGNTGLVTISAAADVDINQPIVNMRTGNALTVTAGNDINVNGQVDGRGGVAGGPVTFTAGRNVSVNNFVVTNNGAIGITATTGTASIAAAKGLYAGTAPINVSGPGGVTTGQLSGGSVTLASSAGSVAVNGLIDGATGAVGITAAGDVNLNQTILNLQSGNALTVAAGNDVNVNGPIEGRGGVAGGAVNLTGSRNVNVNDSVVTNNAAIGITATNGALTVASGKGLFSGTAPITLAAKGDITTGTSTSGTLSVSSSAGAVNLNGKIDPSTGAVNVAAATDVNITQPVLNLRSGANFAVTAGNDINVSTQIDGRGGATGGAVTLTAGRNVSVNDFVTTNNGTIGITATNGTATLAAAKALAAGTGAITVSAKGDIAMGEATGGSVTLNSSAGSVAVNGLIDSATGAVGITAAVDVNVNHSIQNLKSGAGLTVAAGNDVNVNAQIEGRGGIAGGAVSLTGARNVNVNDSIATNNGAIGITATNGAITVAAGKGLFAGTAPITLDANGSVTAGESSSGPLNVTSSAGAVNLNGKIDPATGAVNVAAATDVNITQPVLNLQSGANFAATAGNDINVNAQIDGRGGVAGGGATLTAGRNVSVNDFITTNNGPIGITATNGTVTIAPTKGLAAGTGAITVSAKGDIATGETVGGSVTLNSSAGSIAVNGLIDVPTGPLNIAAAGDVSLNHLLNLSGLSVLAGNDVHVNAQVDGRGGAAGAPVSLTGGRNVNVNDSVLTNNGAIGITATNGAITVAAGKGLFAGTAPITLSGKTSVTTGESSSGTLSVTSSAGAVNLNGKIGPATGAVNVTAATDVNVAQPVLNLQSGANFAATAGNDINVSAQIDGRGGVPGGAVTLNAGRNVSVNDFVTTNNGAIGITATNGTATIAASKGLAAGSGAISVSGGGGVTTAALSGGSVTLNSSAGSIAVNGLIDAATGAVGITAAGDVNLNQSVQNLKSGAGLTVAAGNDVNVNAQIEGRGGVSGGAVSLTGARNVNVNESIATNNGAIGITATNGALTVAAAKGLFAGTAPITLAANGNITTGESSSGTLSVTSSAGAVSLNGKIDPATGAVTVSAGTSVNVNQPITNVRSTAPLTLTAGTDINVNQQIDGRDANAASPSGSVTMTAGQNINVNQNVATENSALTLTAQNGTITTAATKGLFAGSGPISVTSGGTLNTGILSTTGTLGIRSTAGNVNINNAIDGATGAVTVNAAGAVNVNQGIANTRSDAPLTINAGTNINVNAKIDGRDNNAASPSGTTTLTAGQNISVNQDIVTENRALTLTAQNGTIVTAATKGLYAGNGALSVTSGGTLNTGILSTTGPLAIRSTAGGVNVNTPIDDTTGAVTINAAGAVNVNQPITNIKTGNNLTVTAGSDINVNARIDGGSGTAAGGAVTLTAGNNLNVNEHITTNNGTINVTATNGSVVLSNTRNESATDTEPRYIQLNAGNAPINIVSGGDFSTGVAPAQPIPPNSAVTQAELDAEVQKYLRQFVQLVTAGPLNITSSHGSVNVDAPILGQTGPVTITAANAINVKHRIHTNSQPITLNGGRGGITLFKIDDDLHETVGAPEGTTAPIDARNANLTLNSIGNVTLLDTVATQKTLTIDTRAQLISGSTAFSIAGGYPQKIVLNADGGIVDFNAYNFGEVFANSSNGTITLGLNEPSKLRITTGCATCDINTAFFSPDAILNAGGTINLGFSSGGTVELIAGSDVNLKGGQFDQLTATAGRDVKLDSKMLWMGPSPGNAGGGPLSFSAGRDILIASSSPIHISNSQILTLNAGGSVTLHLLETLGPVNISATSGNITLNNDIGPHILNNTTDPLTGTLPPSFNPSDKGVASLFLSAPGGHISMQGARAEGNVTISTSGALTAAKAITSVSGTVSITAGTTSLSAVPIGSQDQLLYSSPPIPGITPGPIVPNPFDPNAASTSTGLPILTEIAVDTQPGGITVAVTEPNTTTGSLALPGSPTGVSAPGAIGDALALPGSPGGVSAPGAIGDAVALPGIPGGANVPGAIADAFTLPSEPTGAGAPGTAGGVAANPDIPIGNIVGLPPAPSDEGVIDGSNAERAAQQESGGEGSAGAESIVVALATLDPATGEQTVLCPPGAAPGTQVKAKDSAGRPVTATCK